MKRLALVPTFALILVLAALDCPAAQKDFHFWVPCSTAQFAEYEKGLKERKWENALHLASCYAAKAESGRGDALENSKKGREYAELAVMKMPGSATAHYLLAVLIGDVANNDPWYDKMTDGLAMVPKIQHQAALAAKLDPSVDRGGPDYVLGQLYLQAPEPPMSIGSPDKALDHFRLAVKIAPDDVANHVGLARAYVKKKDKKKACAQIEKALQLPEPTLKVNMKYWKRAKDMRENICADQGGMTF